MIGKPPRSSSVCVSRTVQSGKAPTAYSSIKTYLPTAGPNDAAAVTPNTIGNPNLGPERGKELETGFDADGWGDRTASEFIVLQQENSRRDSRSESSAVVGPVGHAADQHRRHRQQRPRDCRSVHGTPISRRNVSARSRRPVLDERQRGHRSRHAGSVLRRRRDLRCAPSSRVIRRSSWFEKRVVSSRRSIARPARRRTRCARTRFRARAARKAARHVFAPAPTEVRHGRTMRRRYTSAARFRRARCRSTATSAVEPLPRLVDV